MFRIQLRVALFASSLLAALASSSNPPQCYDDFNRCAGAAGYEYIPWAPCCAVDSRCEEAPERGWGLFCIPKGPEETVSEFLDSGDVTQSEKETHGPSLNDHDTQNEKTEEQDEGRHAFEEAVEVQCYATSQRCQGAPGHPYYQYKPCCSPKDSCLPSTNGDWGKFCTSAEASPIPVSDVVQEVPEEDVEPTSCYKDNIRCQGAPGHPYWQWKRCCSHEAQCVDAPELGWGKFCINRKNPSPANAQESPAVQQEQDAPSHSTTIMQTTAPPTDESQFQTAKPFLPRPSAAATVAPQLFTTKPFLSPTKVAATFAPHTSYTLPQQGSTSPALFTTAPEPSNPGTSQDPGLCLSANEVDLAVLINSYRVSKNLPQIPLSKSLSKVAKLHVEDLESQRPHAPASCNLHSWSTGSAQWTGMCYTRDHKQASKMWSKPREITNGLYHDIGFEIAYYRSLGATPGGALDGWKSSSTHWDVIEERGRYWTNRRWPAMGIGMRGSYAVVWFGSLSDPAGEIEKC